MTRFLYAGGRSAVDLRLPSGRWLDTVARGDEVEVTEPRDAAALFALPDWLLAEPDPDHSDTEETPE